ncbi:sigma factor-like helix-turn-helix DNA-binding protein [Streptosporangium sp. OZ121]|uniref:sigma factor-like helix-turn-helix DNA-binding protein n=1 Tax=Streptosporangium sp. OZ121 TaxID=3444183 RepID=UPI003F7AA21F
MATTSGRWCRGALADQDAEGHQQAQGIDPALMAALLRSPRRQREVVALRVFLDLDTEATAKTLGIAPGTVTARSPGPRRRAGR